MSNKIRPPEEATPVPSDNEVAGQSSSPGGTLSPARSSTSAATSSSSQSSVPSGTSSPAQSSISSGILKTSPLSPRRENRMSMEYVLDLEPSQSSMSLLSEENVPSTKVDGPANIEQEPSQSLTTNQTTGSQFTPINPPSRNAQPSPSLHLINPVPDNAFVENWAMSYHPGMLGRLDLVQGVFPRIQARGKIPQPRNTTRGMPATGHLLYTIIAKGGRMHLQVLLNTVLEWSPMHRKTGRDQTVRAALSRGECFIPEKNLWRLRNENEDVPPKNPGPRRKHSGDKNGGAGSHKKRRTRTKRKVPRNTRNGSSSKDTQAVSARTQTAIGKHVSKDAEVGSYKKSLENWLLNPNRFDEWKEPWVQQNNQRKS